MVLPFSPLILWHVLSTHNSGFEFKACRKGLRVYLIVREKLRRESRPSDTQKALPKGTLILDSKSDGGQTLAGCGCGLAVSADDRLHGRNDREDGTGTGGCLKAGGPTGPRVLLCTL